MRDDVHHADPSAGNMRDVACVPLVHEPQRQVQASASMEALGDVRDAELLAKQIAYCDN